MYQINAAPVPNYLTCAMVFLWSLNLLCLLQGRACTPCIKNPCSMSNHHTLFIHPHCIYLGVCEVQSFNEMCFPCLLVFFLKGDCDCGYSSLRKWFIGDRFKPDVTYHLMCKTLATCGRPLEAVWFCFCGCLGSLCLTTENKSGLSCM